MAYGFPAAMNITLLTRQIGRRRVLEIAITGDLYTGIARERRHRAGARHGVLSMEPMITIPEGQPGRCREHDILVVTEDRAENITGFPYGPEHNIVRT